MRILVVNPVGHDKWDSSDKKIYESYASEETKIDVVSLPRGPASVESAEAYAQVEPLVIELVREIHGGYDAVIVNCFLDPGVAKLRELLGKVVVGPCEASLSLARNLSKKVSIITVGGDAETLNIIRERIKSLGFEAFIISLRGIPLRVLDLDRDREATMRFLVDEARKAVSEGAEVLVLGCTGLAGMAREVSDEVGVPVIDPVWAALKVAELLTSLVGDA
ncbi:MAG: aspartate/glutamate racemase family protein [Zestosphaera sp.]